MGLWSVEAGHRFVDICTMTTSISACTLSTPLYQISVMASDCHNVFLVEVFQPLKQHTMSNQAVAGFDDDCTFVPARIDVKIERAYTMVDLVFRDIRLDFSHYGLDRSPYRSLGLCDSWASKHPLYTALSRPF
jgi:hypothetical protein